MENNRNFFITIALSVLILTLWQVFYMNPRIESQREAQRIEAQRAEAEKKTVTPAGQPQPAPAGKPAASGGTPAAVPGSAGVPGTDGASQATRDAALAATGRVPIDTPRVSGSINLTGGRLDDLRLKDYHLTVDKNSPTIELLNPSSLPNVQYAEIGFAGTPD